MWRINYCINVMRNLFFDRLVVFLPVFDFRLLDTADPFESHVMIVPIGFK